MIEMSAVKWQRVPSGVRSLHAPLVCSDPSSLQRCGTSGDGLPAPGVTFTPPSHAFTPSLSRPGASVLACCQSRCLSLAIGRKTLHHNLHAHHHLRLRLKEPVHCHQHLPPYSHDHIKSFLPANHQKLALFTKGKTLSILQALMGHISHPNYTSVLTRTCPGHISPSNHKKNC